MYCPRCGSLCKDTDKFCKHCGSELPERPQAAAVEPEPAYAAVYAPPDPQHFAPAPSYQQHDAALAPVGAATPDVVSPAAPAPATTPREHVRDDWNFVITWLLAIVTLGIYGLYFYHCIAKGLNTMCRDDGKKTKGVGFYIGISIITLGIYAIVWTYQVGERIRDNAGRFGADVTSGGGALIACTLGGGALVALFIWVPFLGVALAIGVNLLFYHLLADNYDKLAKAYNQTL